MNSNRFLSYYVFFKFYCRLLRAKVRADKFDNAKGTFTLIEQSL